MNRKQALRWGVFVVILAVGIGYVYTNADRFRALSDVKLGWLPLLFIPPFLTFFIAGRLNKALVESFGPRLKFREWYGLSVVTSLGNHVLPMYFGASVRAAYLKAYKRFPVSAFVSTLAATYLIQTLLAATIAAIGVYWYTGLSAPGMRVLFFVLAGVVIAEALVLWFRFPMVSVIRDRLPPVARLLEGWERIRANRRLVVVCSGLLLSNLMLAAVNLKLCFYVLSIECPFPAALSIVAMLAFTRLIAISPANLGIQEAATAVFAHILDIGFDQGLLAAVLARIPLTLVTFTVGPVFAYLLSGERVAKPVDTEGD